MFTTVDLEGDMPRINYGTVGVNLQACVPEVREFCEQGCRRLYSLPSEAAVTDEVDLWVITPTIPKAGDYPTRLRPEDKLLAEACHHAWASALGGERSDPDQQHCQPALPGWRLFLDNLVPLGEHFMLFGHRDESRNIFFCFAQSLHVDASALIDDSIRYIVQWWCSGKGSVNRLHASSVRRNGKGFVFAATSGGGKTTTARESVAAGAQVIDDETSFISRSPDGGYSVLSPGVWQRNSRPKLRLIPNLYTGAATPLSTIFFLVQDLSDYLVRVHPATAVGILLERASDLSILGFEPRLTERMLDACCSIAKEVPVYELHCRKGPGFWSVIDELVGG